VEHANLDDPTARVPRWLAVQMLDLAAGGDPAVGLRAGEATRAADFDVVEYAARAASTLGEGALCFARHLKLIDEGTEFSIEAFEGRLLFRARTQAGLRQPQAANDFLIAATLAFVRRNAVEYEAPLEVWLAHPEPSYSAHYRAIFGAPVRFDAPCNGLVVRAERALTPMRHANPDLFRTLEAHAVHLLRQAEASDGLSSRIRRRLLQQLQAGPLEMQETAQSEGMAVATLRRRLHDEGTTFAELVESVRHDLALRYLRDADGSVKDIAFRLGYREINSFSRAFRRWTGMTPVVYRTLARAA
jgi:AraC-like DNA-binding protein